jgi:hypothetical protein
VTLQEGYIWAIPLFGSFSTALDSMVPGSGHSRISGLTASFRMTNSVFHTTNLQLRSPAMRLDYRGSIDFAGNVDARVEAQVLRETAFVGPLISFVLSPLTKALEYKVTGTLGEPKAELLYIPKALLLPLNPLRTLREMLGTDPKERRDF